MLLFTVSRSARRLGGLLEYVAPLYEKVVWITAPVSSDSSSLKANAHNVYKIMHGMRRQYSFQPCYLPQLKNHACALLLFICPFDPTNSFLEAFHVKLFNLIGSSHMRVDHAMHGT
jgi:hypothetical protein